jgi:heterodisulfide reductase subunit D
MILEEYKEIVHRCFRCGYCKTTSSYSDLNCPSYAKFRFETYSTGGRMWLIFGLMSEQIEWSENLAKVLYACTTCAQCCSQCRFDSFNDSLVDIIEAARRVAVENGFCPEKQVRLLELTTNPANFNPYGEPNSDNSELKEKYNLPDKAEWVYYIGCTSNYRRQELRDATLRFLKKINLDFTLIDEHCCCSPIIRTGQTQPVKEFMNYNIEKIKETGAKKVVTSCAGCYRTLKNDFEKFGVNHELEIVHTSELVKQLLDEGKIEIKSNFDKTITYHDPCHLGRHSGIYEEPREVYKKIPGVTLVEMRRNRENAWCCGAGGGVKIGFPEWSVEVSKERLEEAKETGASIVSSTCPFCKTNLGDANREFNMDFEILDLIEILDQLEIELKNEVKNSEEEN